MGVVVKWHDEQRGIITMKYEKQWIWDDHHRAIDEIGRISLTADIRHVIADMRDTSLPKGSPTSAHSREKGGNGLVVMVINSLVVRTLISVAMRVTPSKFVDYEVVSSLEDAEKAIAAYDAKRAGMA